MRNFSIYIHIPFCEVKCGYCDFFSVARGYEDFDLQKQYVDELIREIETRSEPYQGKKIHTLFFGGGTPSLLESKLLEKIIQTLSKYFMWSSETEFTMEANPKTVSLEKLKIIRSLGVNRLSMGVQSFEDRFLKVLGRIHSGDEAKKTIADAYQAGFEKVNFDMIMALPGQTFEDRKKDLETALSFHPQHLSAYHLTIEAGTAFEKIYGKSVGAIHELPLPSEDVGVQCLTWTRDRLRAAGLPPYEISNFAKPGFECRHNQNYWEYGEYLGCGAGAASFLKMNQLDASSKKTFAVRQTNHRDLKKYISGDWLGFSEEITHKMGMGEYCMLALRTREGVNTQTFEALFGQEFYQTYEKYLKKYQDQHFLIKNGHHFTLTEQGILYADTIVSDFI
ncbi:MAG: radical SAM family heme chaperone HemW [Deltaproteobacteria bacterium]|nr:MAG: radical SAM family heme chaperone HemW [Deltaproteobacteria bacterium]